MKIIKIKAKSIFTKTKLPSGGLVINQYIGCAHACLYCYAKFIARWRPLSYGRWGNWIEIKENAPELIKGRCFSEEVYMSSVSDPYQPIENKLKLTRRILENLDKRIRLSIQTRSDLVLRDIDLFKKFPDLEIGFTLNSFPEEIKKLFEPHSPSNHRRLRALKILKEKKIKTYGFVSPIIPNLTKIKKIIKESKDSVDYFWFEVLNLKASGKEFIHLLKKKFPESYQIMTNQRKFFHFLEQLRKEIKEEKILASGIEIHFPFWQTLKI